MIDNPFDEVQDFLDNLDKQPKHVREAMASITTILDESVQATYKAQESVVGQYVDDYDVSARTPLNRSLEASKLKSGDMLLFLAASCAMDEPESFPDNFADSVKDSATRFDRAMPEDAKTHIQKFHAASYDAPIETTIDDGVSFVLNEVGNIFLRDFSRRMEAYLDRDESPSLVVV